MSDGPYKSLPMSRAWKRVAEFARNENFDADQMCEAAWRALMRDWRANVPLTLIHAVRDVFCGTQTGLFADYQTRQLDGLRGLAGTQSLARLFLDCAVVNAEAGHAGHAALIKSAVDALLARGARGARQVEEHYLRKSTAALAKTVRARLEHGITSGDLEGCARVLLKIAAPPPARSPIKHQGLDEGVPIERAQ
jgi:hypothetical protein